MQIIEQTGFGVRSAVIRMVRLSGGPTFLLFPMLHVASPAFYRQMQERMFACDVLVVEGVGGNRAKVITLAYRIAGRVRRSGLVLQSESVKMADYHGTVIRPDMTAKEFGSVWRTLSFGLRVLLYLATPLVGLWIAILGPRRTLGNSLALDDLPTAKEEELTHEQMEEVFLRSRDAALIRSLSELVDAPADGPITVGVVWGARHMRAVVTALHARGYVPRSGDWIMAIPPDWR
ncbi:MAG TPA: hypothetical protein VG650_06480 [Mycobacteriales bacterium]|nr:hypothetical protein [Mycobacteriales bacterium]